MNLYFTLLLLTVTLVPVLASAQSKDSAVVIVKKAHFLQKARDSAGNRIFNPRKAALYSAILPGLGQVYNRKYWKVPIVYAAVGIPVYLFFDNKKMYNQARYAMAVTESTEKGTQSWNDSLNNVNAIFKNAVIANRQSSIMNRRNEIRKDMDYSILFTLLFWGLNVIDATVDAHLKAFSVSDNLALQVRPALLANQAIGVSVVFRYQ